MIAAGCGGSDEVLIVEPDTVLSGTYAEFLRYHGCRVRTVTSAQAAIMAIDHRMPDIIVLEPLMARHNGIEFLYELRSYREWEDIPVIVLSWRRGYEYGDTAILNTMYGVAACLYKRDTTLPVLADAVNKCRMAVFRPAAAGRSA